MTGHAIPRVRMTTTQVWETDRLVTELIADDEPTAHYVADTGTSHGHQLTANPETACGRVVPNSMLTGTEYDDVRCVDCLAARPEAEPYPADPVVVGFSCSVCPDGGSINFQDGLGCDSCGTCWPKGEYAPGIREYPVHVHVHTGVPLTGDEPTTMTPRSGMLDIAPFAMRGLADGEEPHVISTHMVQAGMRVLCDHDHPSAWVLVLCRADGTGDPEAGTVILKLACGWVDERPTSGTAHVVVDPPLPVAEVDESRDA